MIFDIFVALVIVIVGVVLGIIEHPLLAFICVLAVVWLLVRHGRHSRL